MYSSQRLNEDKSRRREERNVQQLKPQKIPRRVWRPKEVKVKRPVISQSSDKSNLMREESSVIRDKSPSHDAMGVSAVFILPSKSCNQESRFCSGARH
jgi:hypothetical protein